MSILGHRLTAAIPRAYEPLIAIAGQSNALGAAVDIRASLELPWRVYAGLDAGTWPADLDVLQWKYLTTRSGNHHGLEYGLANSAIINGAKPTIVKGAVNGSGLGDSANAGWLKSIGEIYTPVIEMLQEAQILAGRKVDSFIWNQGESDCNDEPRANIYAANLTTFFEDLRSDLGSPNMRAIICRLHVDYPSGFPEIIRAQQAAFVATDSNAILVNVDDLALNDGVHLTSASYDTLGSRCWTAHIS